MLRCYFCQAEGSAENAVNFWFKLELSELCEIFVGNWFKYVARRGGFSFLSHGDGLESNVMTTLNVGTSTSSFSTFSKPRRCGVTPPCFPRPALLLCPQL